MSVFVYFYICHFNQNGWKSIYFLTFFRSVYLILHTPPVLLRLASSDFPSVSINGRLFILELKQFHKSQSILQEKWLFSGLIIRSYVTSQPQEFVCRNWLTIVSLKSPIFTHMQQCIWLCRTPSTDHSRPSSESHLEMPESLRAFSH